MSGRRATPALYLRSAAYWLVLFTSTVFYGLFVGLFAWLLPRRWCWVPVHQWAAINLHALRWICGLRWRVEGTENLPDRPVVVFAKHQSSWETMALALLLPPQVWVVKRELLWVPFFGWGLAAMRPIAIDRSAGHLAVEQMLRQGRQRLRQGLWVMVFPEGTRVRPGTTVRYRLGGAVVATETGTPVLPIAHNAGDFWPRHSFIKWPGEIVISIRPPIPSAGKTPEALNDEVRAVIEGEMERISSHGAAVVPDTEAAADEKSDNHR